MIRLLREEKSHHNRLAQSSVFGILDMKLIQIINVEVNNMELGENIKRLRRNMGITQEQLAGDLHVSHKTISKWENGTAFPDVMWLPELAAFFNVSIDELMGYQLKALTNKERFVQSMVNEGVLKITDKDILYDSEKLSSNVQITKIGELFADCIKENKLQFDAVLGLAYHGIAFSIATVCVLYKKYGMISNYCYDRQCADRRGRKICGYSLQDGDKVIVVDDFLLSGQTLAERIDTIRKSANIQIAAVFVIADGLRQSEGAVTGSEWIENKYQTKVFSVVTQTDIDFAVKEQII